MDAMFSFRELWRSVLLAKWPSRCVRWRVSPVSSSRSMASSSTGIWRTIATSLRLRPMSPDDTAAQVMTSVHRRLLCERRYRDWTILVNSKMYRNPIGRVSKRGIHSSLVLTKAGFKIWFGLICRPLLYLMMQLRIYVSRSKAALYRGHLTIKHLVLPQTCAVENYG